MLAGRAKIRGGLVDVSKGGRRRVHIESLQARQSGRMVIARDRRSGVSRNILGGFTLRPERPHPNRTPILPRSSKAAYALRQAGTFAAGCQRQPKCDPLAAKCQRLAGLQPLSRRRASVDPEADALTARARRAMLGDAIVPKLFGQRDPRSLSSCAERERIRLHQRQLGVTP
jgi:hypothetical protein